MYKNKIYWINLCPFLFIILFINGTRGNESSADESSAMDNSHDSSISNEGGKGDEDSHRQSDESESESGKSGEEKIHNNVNKISMEEKEHSKSKLRENRSNELNHHEAAEKDINKHVNAKTSERNTNMIEEDEIKNIKNEIAKGEDELSYDILNEYLKNYEYSSTEEFDEMISKSTCLHFDNTQCSRMIGQCIWESMLGVCLRDCNQLPEEKCHEEIECYYSDEYPDNRCINHGMFPSLSDEESALFKEAHCELISEPATCRLISYIQQNRIKKLFGNKEIHDKDTKFSNTICSWQNGADEMNGNSPTNQLCINLLARLTQYEMALAKNIALSEESIEKAEGTGADINGLCQSPNFGVDAIYNPSKLYYVVGDNIEVSCKPGNVLIGSTNKVQCYAGGKIQPALYCVPSEYLSPSTIYTYQKLNSLYK